MTTPRASFADRLNVARRLLARGASRPPVHLANQLEAAGKDARVLHDRLVAALPILQPDRQWYGRVEVAPSDEVKALLLAAILDCTTMCIHLRRGGPRPAFVQLPLRRVDCERCVRTLRRPPPENDDQCDICDRHGVVTFHPFACRQGPLLLAGDACADCAAALGIVQEVSA